MDRVAGGRPIPGNRVELRYDGPQVYPAMLERIAAAKRWIHLDNYIIRGDATGRRFAAALAERARAGVPVRVLTDWLGSFSTRRRFWNELRAAGVEIRFFGPLDLWNLTGNLTRDHRKILVVDGDRAVTGGLCLGDEWSGDEERGRHPWRDTGVAIDGPAAAMMDHAFAAVWNLLGTTLPADELASDVAPRGTAAVRVLAGEPGGVRVSRTIELLLAGASERVWITDAYLVAPRGIYRGLLDAAQQGVDVRLLVPGTSDLPHVRNLTRAGYRDLLAAGVRIYEWRGPMLHAKTAVVDGRWVRIGSTNLNLSSLIANYEMDVLIDDVSFAQDLEARFRRDLDASVEVRLQPARVFRDRLSFHAPGGTSEHHLPGLRERRRRTVVALRAAIGGSQRALFVQRVLALALLGLLLIVFPRPTGLVIGGLALWVALTTTVDVVRDRLRRPD
jgi:cardiolipin synthase